MPKVTLVTLGNLDNPNSVVATINANFAELAAAMEKTLSRDGTAPNTLDATIDANGQRIINLPEATEPTDAARAGDLVTFRDDAVQAASDAADSETNAASSAASAAASASSASASESGATDAAATAVQAADEATDAVGDLAASPDADTIVVVTESEYAALTPDPTTLYLVTADE